MSVHVFVDLSAVFLRTKELGAERVDYAVMQATLSARLNREIAGNSVTAFSSLSLANEGQASFLNHLRGRLGWHVETRAARLAEVGRDQQDRPVIRFDALIGFAAGLCTKDDRSVILVSDSFALEPVLQAMSTRGVRAFLGFWGSLLDARWHAAIRGGSAFDFVDFDHTDRILGRRIDRTHDSFLRHLS